MVCVNNDFGKGGRDAFAKGLRRAASRSWPTSRPRPARSTSPPRAQAKSANADAIFVYTNEEEGARLLRELRKQGVDKPIVGETTLTGQKVIELAGDAANGAMAHVGLTVDAPNPPMLEFGKKFEGSTSTSPTTTASRATSALHDQGRGREGRQARPRGGRQGDARPDHQRRQGARRADGLTWDDNGDLDRESFIVEVKDGKQVVKETLPAGRSKARTAGTASERRAIRERRPSDYATDGHETLAFGPPLGHEADGSRFVRESNMTDFLQLLFSGLATGAIYALAALGFTLLWQASRRSTSRRASS